MDTSTDTKTTIAAGVISMCESCERVPVPVYSINQGRRRGFYLCADCLAEDGIHIGDDADSTNAWNATKNAQPVVTSVGCGLDEWHRLPNLQLKSLLDDLTRRPKPQTNE